MGSAGSTILALSSPLIGLAIARWAAWFCAAPSGAVGPGAATEVPTALRDGFALRLSIALGATAVGLASILALDPAEAVVGAAFGWALLATAASDALCYLLPNAIMIAIAAGGIVECALAAPEQLPDRIIGGAGGFLALRLLGAAFARRKGYAAIGSGDALLLGALGLWIGWQLLPYACLAAAILAGAYLHAVTRGAPDALKTRRVPFGLFLAAAGWAAWLCGRAGWAAVAA